MKTEDKIKELNEAINLMNDVKHMLTILSEENMNLKVMLWRMVKKYGGKMKADEIDNKTLNKLPLLTIKLYKLILCIRFIYNSYFFPILLPLTLVILSYRNLFFSFNFFKFFCCF